MQRGNQEQMCPPLESKEYSHSYPVKMKYVTHYIIKVGSDVYDTDDVHTHIRS